MLISAIVLGILFFTTDPQSARLLGVLIVVIALYGLFWGIILMICNIFNRKKMRQKTQSELLKRKGNSKIVELSAVIALAPVLIIVLNSLGSIGLVELILILVFECIIIFLIRKKK